VKWKEYLDTTSAVVGLISFVPILWTWWVVTKRKRAIKKWRNSLYLQESAQGAVVVSVGGRDITKRVIGFIEKNPELKRAIPEKNIYPVVYPYQILGSEAEKQLGEIYDMLKETESKLEADLIKTVHLFIQAPLPVAVMVGAFLKNREDCILYHYSTGPNDSGKTDSYDSWGPMEYSQ
jgi:hypothetical protein